MSLHKSTSIKHLSYQELDAKLRDLAELMRSKGQPISLKPAALDETIVTHLLSHFSGYPVYDLPTSLRVSLIGEIGSDVCVYKKNYTSEHYNRSMQFYVDELFQEEDETFTQITLPWKK